MKSIFEWTTVVVIVFTALSSGAIIVGNLVVNAKNTEHAALVGALVKRGTAEDANWFSFKVGTKP